MRKVLLGCSIILSTQVLAMSKGEADQKILNCTKKSIISIFVNLMEVDQGLKPGPSGYKIFCNKAQIEDKELSFDDSSLAPITYYTLDNSWSMTGRLKNFSIKPFKHAVNTSINTKDENGYVRTDFYLSYKPKSNSQNLVKYEANYIPTVVFDFDELVWDSFGRIDPSSTIRTLKVVAHPFFGTADTPLKVQGTGEESNFKFSSKVFMDCMKGDQ
jgi:hypothetical protein